MSWASNRRLAYISVVLFGVLAVVLFVGLVVFYEAPTCFDGKRNGTEEGVDCGGSCDLICSFSAADIEILADGASIGDERCSRVRDGLRRAGNIYAASSEQYRYAFANFKLYKLVTR